MRKYLLVSILSVFSSLAAADVSDGSGFNEPIELPAVAVGGGVHHEIVGSIASRALYECLMKSDGSTFFRSSTSVGDEPVLTFGCLGLVGLAIGRRSSDQLTQVFFQLEKTQTGIDTLPLPSFKHILRSAELSCIQILGGTWEQDPFVSLQGGVLGHGACGREDGRIIISGRSIDNVLNITTFIHHKPGRAPDITPSAVPALTEGERP